MINKETGRTKRKIPPNDAELSAKAFNDYYSEIGDKIPEGLDNSGKDSHEVLTATSRSPRVSCYIGLVTPQEIISIIHSVKSKNSRDICIWYEYLFA
ncbi:hypothetical protein QE152_g37868 [Popillia japonica]|uniref:Uncharacterized protein n=1 Tax=Popillia japonica TaxID=7064 RepID=A0AAW1I8S2_POPJA